MSKFHPIESLKEKVSHVDGLTVGKWVCLIGAGLIALVGNALDTKRKDRIYEEKMDQEIQRQSKRLLEQDNN